MSRFETSMTCFGTMLAFMAGHVLCCGFLPVVLNASAHALMGAAGFDVLLALVTLPAMAYGVTLWERRRHHTVCLRSRHRSNQGCTHQGRFHFPAHFARNLVIGMLMFCVLHLVMEMPFMDRIIENLIGSEGHNHVR